MFVCGDVMATTLTSIARNFGFITETDGPNRGPFVSMLQRFCYGQDGDSWCADFVSFVLDLAYHGKPPLRRTGSSQLMLSEARTKGFIVPAPLVDGLFFYVTPVGVAHHVGIVTAIAPLTGIAGNTSEDGKSDNGTGVFEHAIGGGVTPPIFVRLP